MIGGRLSGVLLLALAASALWVRLLAGEGPPDILIRAARVHPVASPPIERGQILVRGGKIVAVGQNLTPVAGVRWMDFPGEVFPGLIDGGAPLAIPVSAAEEFRELTPEIRAADGMDSDAREVARALRAGVTAVAVTPGDRNVIGGLGAVVKTAPGRRAGELLRPDAFLSASLTLAAVDGNMNLRSTAPYSYYHRLPTTRMGTVFLLRRACFEALELALPPGEAALPSSSMARLLTASGKTALAETLRGVRPLRLRAQERQEIEAALRISAEFRMPVVLEGFAGGMELIPEVAARKCRVLLQPGGDLGDEPVRDDVRVTLRLAQLLDERGVEFGFASGVGREVALLRDRLSLSLRFGLSAERTLRRATLSTARILGVEERVGSIQPGKDADLVGVRGGGPLERSSAVEWVMVDGRIYNLDGGKEPHGDL
jgi:imidazolonepropionase-like amidohydrolase